MDGRPDCWYPRHRRRPFHGTGRVKGQRSRWHAICDPEVAGYIDPDIGQLLPTFAEAVAAIDETDQPAAHTARLGNVDPREMKGVTPGSPEAERCIRYVAKYVTKSLGDTAAA